MRTFRRSYVQRTYLRTESAELIDENEEGAMMLYAVTSGPENGNDAIPKSAWAPSADILVRYIALLLLLLRESQARYLLRLHDGRFGAKSIAPSATQLKRLITDYRRPWEWVTIGQGIVWKYTLR